MGSQRCYGSGCCCGLRNLRDPLWLPSRSTSLPTTRLTSSRSPPSSGKQSKKLVADKKITQVKGVGASGRFKANKVEKPKVKKVKKPKKKVAKKAKKPAAKKSPKKAAKKAKTPKKVKKAKTPKKAAKPAAKKPVAKKAAAKKPAAKKTPKKAAKKAAPKKK